MSDNVLKRRANAHFRKPPGVEDGDTIMSESETIAAAVTANSARLKDLRLARDAAVHAAPPIPVKKSRGKKKRPAQSLSDWLKNRRVAAR
jgi:hypothetical protein